VAEVLERKYKSLARGGMEAMHKHKLKFIDCSCLLWNLPFSNFPFCRASQVPCTR
jgi:hypothetical protein